MEKILLEIILLIIECLLYLFFILAVAFLIVVCFIFMQNIGMMLW
jgi:hypothetical protein